MPKYNNVLYAGGYYGQQSRLAFSVQPFTAVTIDYDKVHLTWSALPNPDGAAFNAVRLVRNQVAFPETQEDGVILWEETNLVDPFSISEFIDGQNNTPDVNGYANAPLVPGRFAYYRMWLRKDDNIWYEAGDAFTLIPKDHGATAFSGTTTQSTHDKFMDLLPKVFTSATQSPIDNVDPTSTLYTFLKGFSLTLDELLTYADVLRPNYSGLSVSPDVVSLQAYQLGLPQEYSLGLRPMKRLVREATFLHNNKGTALGVQTLAESLTGFAPTVTQTKNLMLSMQDSTFYKGVGNWLPVGNCVVTSVDNQVIATGNERTIDQTYSGKVVVSTANAKIVNGTNSPKTKGIPVSSTDYYNVSFYAKSAASSASVTVTAHWYNYLGVLLSSNTSSPFSLTSSWTRVNFDDIGNVANAAYMTIDVQFNTTGTYYVDMFQVAVALAPETPAYEEARGVDVLLAPSKVNYLKNPSFDVINSEWTIDDVSHTLVDSTFAHAVGMSKMLQSVTKTGAVTRYDTSTDAGLPVGTFYTASIYARTTSGTEDFVLGMQAAGTGGMPYTSAASDVVTLTTEWQRIHVTLYVPESYGTGMAISVSLIGEATTGNTIDLDGAQLETAYLPTDYFDGEFPAAYGASWAGTANESISYLYPNKLIKIPRLIANLAEYMPIGTPYYVSTYEGLEYAGIS